MDVKREGEGVCGEIVGVSGRASRRRESPRPAARADRTTLPVAVLQPNLHRTRDALAI